MLVTEDTRGFAVVLLVPFPSWGRGFAPSVSGRGPRSVPGRAGLSLPARCVPRWGPRRRGGQQGPCPAAPLPRARSGCEVWDGAQGLRALPVQVWGLQREGVGRSWEGRDGLRPLPLPWLRDGSAPCPVTPQALSAAAGGVSSCCTGPLHLPHTAALGALAAWGGPQVSAGAALTGHRERGKGLHH